METSCLDYMDLFKLIKEKKKETRGIFSCQISMYITDNSVQCVCMYPAASTCVSTVIERLRVTEESPGSHSVLRRCISKAQGK